ncbi:MAG TPA: HAD family phosphatase [Acidimicrobiales bacterium]|nr:HAD family phosphatase [Acidimicrobiales bacterium]
MGGGSDIEAVIFDYGGVLATSQWDVLAQVETNRGYPSGTFGLVFGAALDPERPDLPSWYLLETGELRWSEFVRRSIEQAAGQVDGRTLDGADFEPLEELMPLGAQWAVIHRVRQLRARGLATAICTNNVAEFGPYWRSTVPLELFDVVVDSCEEGVRKPDPAIYLRTAERLACPPAACAFLDDSAANVAGAESVGMTGVLVGPDAEAAMDELDALLSASLRRG